jgi:hypothetical protein
VNTDPLQLLRDAVERTRTLTRTRPATGRSHDSADETTGTFATDSALRFDPLPLLAAVHRAGARVVVIGQVAGILHGSIELTGDLDLLWDGDPGQTVALAAAFGECQSQLVDNDGVFVPTGPGAFLLPKVQFESPWVSGDCCTPALPWGELPVRDFLDRALTASGPDGLEVHYLCRADLVLMRRTVGRPKDLRRAEELERL